MHFCPNDVNISAWWLCGRCLRIKSLLTLSMAQRVQLGYSLHLSVHSRYYSMHCHAAGPSTCQVQCSWHSEGSGIMCNRSHVLRSSLLTTRGTAVIANNSRCTNKNIRIATALYSIVYKTCHLYSLGIHRAPHTLNIFSSRYKSLHDQDESINQRGRKKQKNDRNQPG